MLNTRLGLTLALTGQLLFTACTQQEVKDFIYSDGSAIADDSMAEFAPGNHQYGKGQLTQEQLGALKSLAWPQTYEAMKGTFGFPAHRTETADYYAIDDSDQWAVVYYNGRTAINYSLENK